MSEKFILIQAKGRTMDYKPRPIDTSDVKLNKSLQDLMEDLARNTHDIWARQRMADGWSLGPERDDAKKTNPCLVDYDDLPESEKQYDRDTASEALKCIIKLGYWVQEPVKAVKQTAHNDMLALMAWLKASKAIATEEMITLWLNHDQNQWLEKPEVYILLGQGVLKRGEALLAYDIFSEGLEAFPDVVYVKQITKRMRSFYLCMRQQQALALAQSGATVNANESLLELYNQGVKDGETLGILSRTYKDLAMKADNPGLRRKSFLSAYEVSLKAFHIAVRRRKTEDAYYNGINAATLALLSGKPKESQGLALEVKNICIRKNRRDSKKGVAESYWLLATLGEAELLLGHLTESERFYRKAGDLGKGNFRDLASTRRQTRMILEHHGQEPSLMDHCFSIPSVVVFSGHMIDEPDRPQKRFPPELEGPVRKEIAKSLDRLNGGIAYASAACGSDIIFLEEMLKRGGEINIVLPFEKEFFLKESVDVPSGSYWMERFDHVFRKASQSRVLGQYHPLMNAPNFEFCNLFLYGSALARAQAMDTELKPLAVWDGRAGDGPGGTAFMIRTWQKNNQAFTPIDLKRLLNENVTAQDSPSPKRPPTIKRLPGKVKYHVYLPMLFADVKGYSALKDEQLVEFSDHFLKCISKITAKYRKGILSKRTQGDGLFLVFRDLATAAHFAIDLRDRIKCVDWKQYRLPEDLTARISLDAGPCYSYVDPIVERMEFCGAYVNRAARIEPITPPGHIYASESFVALSKATGVKEIQFDYVGQVILPKKYGVIPAYHVQAS